MSHAIYVFDFDGTITLKTDDYENASPNKDVVEIIRLIKSRGDTVVIWTARGMRTYKTALDAERRWRATIEKNLKDWDVPYDSLHFGKPAADFYVDDKGVNVNDLSKLIV